MIWRKIQDLSLVKLGAINGAAFGSLILLILGLIYFYIHYVEINYLHAMPLTINWWAPIEILIIVIIASFLAQFISSHIKSTMILWQIIGLITAVETYFYYPLKSFFEHRFRCYLQELQIYDCWLPEFLYYFIPTKQKLTEFAVVLLIAAIFNLIFALIIRKRKPFLR